MQTPKELCGSSHGTAERSWQMTQSEKRIDPGRKYCLQPGQLLQDHYLLFSAEFQTCDFLTKGFSGPNLRPDIVGKPGTEVDLGGAGAIPSPEPLFSARKQSTVMKPAVALQGLGREALGKPLTFF